MQIQLYNNLQQLTIKTWPISALFPDLIRPVNRTLGGQKIKLNLAEIPDKFLALFPNYIRPVNRTFGGQKIGLISALLPDLIRPVNRTFGGQKIGLISALLPDWFRPYYLN
jgi:hypothetical protein